MAMKIETRDFSEQIKMRREKAIFFFLRLSQVFLRKGE